jgi:hypothetical protein
MGKTAKDAERDKGDQLPACRRVPGKRQGQRAGNGADQRKIEDD